MLLDNIDEESFRAKVEELRAEFRDDGEYSVSIGEVWQKEDVDVEKQVKKADYYMYEAKKVHYKNSHYDRRKRK